MNVDAHPITVDVADLKMERLIESEAAGIYGCQIGLILRGVNRIEDTPDLIEAKNGG